MSAATSLPNLETTPVSELNIDCILSSNIANDILLARQRGGAVVRGFINEDVSNSLCNHLFRSGKENDAERVGLSWEYLSGQGMYSSSEIGELARRDIGIHYRDQVELALACEDLSGRNVFSGIIGYARHLGDVDEHGLPWHFDGSKDGLSAMSVPERSRVMAMITLHGYAIFEWQNGANTGKEIVTPGDMMLIDYAKTRHRVSGPLFEESRTVLSYRVH